MQIKLLPLLCRFLFRFGVVLSKPSSFDVAKRESSGHSRVFRRTVALNQDLSQIADGADSFRVNSSDHLNTSPRVGVVSPGESFTVTTCLDLHSFSNPLSSVDLFHAAIVTHAKAAPETGGGLGSSAPYVFQCGRVSLNASQIASNSLSINVERLLDTTTGSRAGKVQFRPSKLRFCRSASTVLEFFAGHAMEYNKIFHIPFHTKFLPFYILYIFHTFYIRNPKLYTM